MSRLGMDPLESHQDKPDVSTTPATATHVRASVVESPSLDDDVKLVTDTPSVTLAGASGFDFGTSCFFCGSKWKQRQMHQWRTVKQNVLLDKVLDAATSRDDILAATVLCRLDGITSLVDVKAKYHVKCHVNFFRPIKSSRTPSPATALNKKLVDTVCKYIEESGKFEFTLTELQDVMKPNFLDRRTLYTKLLNKYGNSIYIRQERGKSTIIYYKYFNIGNLCNKFYWEENYNEFEKEIILKTAARILKTDIKAKEYDIMSYPPATKFLDEVDKDVPDSLQYFMSALIENEQGRDYERNHKKRQIISHSIISAIRPRTFISTLQLAVGTYIYRKTGSKQIIELLDKIGVSVSYHYVQQYEASVILNPPEITLENGVHVQHVFDNTGHNLITLEGSRTFHCMGGIAIYTPEQGVAYHSRIARITNTDATISALIRAKGILSIPYDFKGLKELVYHNTNTLRLGTLPLLPPLYSVYIWAKLFKIPQLPSWSGFMEILSGETPYSVSRIVHQPFIIDPRSNNSTIYAALNFARSECDKLNQKTAFATFDQSLYHKARTIIAESEECGKLKNVVPILGGFHLLMSYFGAIGYIMADSGLEALWSTVYTPKSVKKMMKGHAFSRAMRAHILTYTALGIAIAKSSTSVKTADYEKHVLSLLKDWNSETAQSFTIGDCQNDPVITEMTSEFIAEINRLTNNGPTAQLWLQYFELVSIALQFVEAERLGNWKLHLQSVNQMLPIFHAAGCLPYAKSTQIYLQDMAALESTMDREEYERFTAQGFFTVRRSDKAWSGVWTDMTIEQTINRYIGTQLIHGRGIPITMIARHLLVMPSTCNVMECVDEFFNIQTSSSEEHKDLGISRQKRDEEDLNKFLSWINSHEPFQPRVTVMSLTTEMYGTEIDCHLAIAKGRQAMSSMLGQNAAKISLSMLNKVKNLASLKANLHLAATPHLLVDAALLFRCISVVIEGDPAKTRNALEYELAPYPLTLFDEKGFMRKTSKAELNKLFKIYKSHIPTEIFLEKFLFVLDGGFLLESVCWSHGVTYREIFKRYLTFIRNHYHGNACVVFDGHANDSTDIKSYERYQCGETNLTANVDFTEDMLVAHSQKKFLSNTRNKCRFINLLSKYLQDNNVRVDIAAENVDTLIVNIAISINNSIEDPIVVVGNNIDLLVLLIALNHNERKPIYFYEFLPGKIKDLYSTEDHKDFKEFVLFAHAFTGCTTTSSMYMKDKKTLVNLLQKDRGLQNSTKVFYDPQIQINSIYTAAEQLVLYLYDYNIEGDFSRRISLAQARYQIFMAYAALGSSTIRLAILPPTVAALHQHAKRVYLQIQTWLGTILTPDDWGWKRHSNILHPIMTTENPAPQEILNSISCDCTIDCISSHCGCAKVGIGCSELCKNCNGLSCKNPSIMRRHVSLEENDINESDPDEFFTVKDELCQDPEINIKNEDDEILNYSYHETDNVL